MREKESGLKEETGLVMADVWVRFVETRGKEIEVEGCDGVGRRTAVFGGLKGVVRVVGEKEMEGRCGQGGGWELGWFFTSLDKAVSGQWVFDQKKQEGAQSYPQKVPWKTLPL